MTSSGPLLRDDPARARIARELDRNMLVEAGAGSGKTHELVRRMAAGVASGAYRIEQMAAITFTRKAAAELRGRFQLALETQLAEDQKAAYPASRDPAGSGMPGGDRDARRARTLAALSNLERFFAGTIHAFCARLLRERPVEAGVSPGFVELDDVEDRLLGEQSWRDYRAQAKAAGDPALTVLLDAGIKAQDLDEAFKVICTYEEVIFQPGDAPLPDDQAAWRALEAFWLELLQYLPPAIDPATSCRTQQSARRFARAWRLATGERRTPSRLAELLREWEFAPKITQNRWADDPATRRRLGKLIPERHEQFRTQVVDPFLAAWRRYLYRHVVTLLTGAREAAARERRRRHALSFNDLLLLTARVLRTSPDVREALQQKYRWLFVDEFQDTDPLQAEIMFLLAGERAGTAGPRGIFDLTLRPGALFVVGDPKQSIYRFRRADIDIYNEVRACLAGHDGQGVVSLTTNFRSVPALCEWANDVFEDRFPADPTPQAPMFAPLDAVRPSAEPRPAIVKLTTPAAVDCKHVPEHEAAAIARYISAEVAAGRRAYGDFLVLTRRKKTLKDYAEALEARRIPIEVSGAGAFAESREVRELALLLLALTDPQDAVSLVGVLRGPLFGLSDRDLYAFRESGGWFNTFSHTESGASNPAGPEIPSPPAEAAAPVEAALGSLRRWFKWTRMLPAGAALERILEDSGYLALAATTPDGVEAGDLLHAVDRVRAAVEGGFTLAQAAEALAAYCGLDEEPDDSAEVESLPLRPGRADVVRVMNLHKAKGLEAAVVFLADPRGGFKPRVDARILRAGGSATGYFPIAVKVGAHGRKLLAEPGHWAALEADERAYLDAEGDRLLYVAATRARDTLVVGRYLGKAPHTMAAWDAFEAHVLDAPELAVPDRVEPLIADRVDLSAGAAAAAVAAASAAHERAVQPSWTAASVTAEAKRLPQMKGIPAAETEPDDPTRAITTETPSRRADAGVAWGTLVHGLLEHAMRHPAATRDDLRRLAMWLTMEEPDLRVVIDQAIDTVETVRKAGFWREARAAGEVHEEAPFAIKETVGGLPRVLTGVIDLVYRTGSDGWQVVDYKTDRDGEAADLAVRYREQVAAYERAWATVAQARVTSAVVRARPAAEAADVRAARRSAPRQPKLFD